MFGIGVNVHKSDLDISDHFQAIQTEKYGRSIFFLTACQPD